jgi:hypothetical protein
MNKLIIFHFFSMAGKNGGARPGAGRKPGVSNRPQLRDYYSPDEIAELVKDIKEEAKKDPAVKRWVGEQLFGKAASKWKSVARKANH